MKEVCFFYMYFALIHGSLTFNQDDDVLTFPYRHNARYKRSQDTCDHYAYGNRPHILYPAHEGQPIGVKSETSEEHNISTKNNESTTAQADSDNTKQADSDNTKQADSDNTKDNQTVPSRLPIVELRQSGVKVNEYRYDARYVFYHVAYVNNPAKTLSVYEPLHDGTCRNGSYRPATVMESAASRRCVLATNAGLFNTKTGACYGNIVSDGRIVQDAEGVQNVHFGITKLGQIFIGYLSEIDLVAEDFTQLVGGVIWVLKDGETYIDESIAGECTTTQETGSLYTFSTVQSARTLVGHDKHGRVVILQVEGKTYTGSGVSLYEAAEILKKYGVINAVNMDGGGSSTMVINNTLVNYPSDKCKDDDRFGCMRNVTTILCVHEAPCPSPDCGGRGSCDNGLCRCDGYWKGDNCDTLECPTHCSQHGTCTEAGCECDPGHHGVDCGAECSRGWYGRACTQKCRCDNNATCDGVTGHCNCLAGFSGSLCQFRCRLGYYGEGCIRECDCDDAFICDPVSGACNYTYTDADFIQAGPCFTKKLEQKGSLQGDMTKEYQNAIYYIITVSIITFISVIINIALLCKYCSKSRRRRQSINVKYKALPTMNNSRAAFLFNRQHYSSFTTSTSSEEETSFTSRKSRSAS